MDVLKSGDKLPNCLNNNQTSIENYALFSLLFKLQLLVFYTEAEIKSPLTELILHRSKAGFAYLLSQCGIRNVFPCQLPLCPASVGADK